MQPFLWVFVQLQYFTLLLSSTDDPLSPTIAAILDLESSVFRAPEIASEDTIVSKIDKGLTN